MDKFVIEGGKRLSGTVDISGSKNAVLPILVASLLVEKGEVTVNNVPDLMDIRTIIKLMEHLGAEVKFYPEAKKVIIKADNLNNHEAPYDLVRKMRASFLVMGPLLARLKKAKVSLPGGCVLGQRPVDLHLAGLSKLGAQITEEHGYVIAEAQELNGNMIYFDRPTHTGTENIIMAATLARGETTIINAACDPEVVDLSNFLNSMGAKIGGAGTPIININGVKKLRAVEFSPIHDRLEASTYMMAAAITNGYIELKNLNVDHLNPVINKLKQMGVEFEGNKGKLKIKGPKRLKPISVTTYPHPGFPTDMQASIMALATIADGASQIRETVFEDRFTHVMEYTRLGADIKVSGDRATINGIEKLKGASVMASDIRAGAGLVLAGLAAEGTTEVLRVYHIDRGYEKMEEKLSRLGAEIKRVKT
ncbi:MAG: UDP-N-acetylglucosamine 1-carboxyvinyltransferase [candidate division Zixibacteria bacterium]|nr:UDP-N-acetylglucosamine 1-carboxyvinyltransferase [candidate division Zixibacteria bacterium]